MNEFLQGNSCANHVITQVLYAPERAGSSVIGTNSDTFSSAQNQHPTVGRTSAWLTSLKYLVWIDAECEGADIWVRLLHGRGFMAAQFTRQWEDCANVANDRKFLMPLGFKKTQVFFLQIVVTVKHAVKGFQRLWSTKDQNAFYSTLLSLKSSADLVLCRCVMNTYGVVLVLHK